MVDFFILRVRKRYEVENPPSYEDKIPNCSFPHCDEDGPCDRGREIATALRLGDEERK